MRGQAGSRKRITFNPPRETIRIILLLLLLGSVAAFATSREKTALRVYARTAQTSQPAAQPPQTPQTAPISRAAGNVRPISRQSPVSPSSSQSPKREASPKEATSTVANLEPFFESNGFRLLWVTAGFGLVFLLRCQRRRA